MNKGKILDYVIPVTRTIKLIAIHLVFFPALILYFFLPERRKARLFRNYLQLCGGAWVKVGQVLSSRLDLIPYSYFKELARLTDDLPPTPFDKIKDQVEKGLQLPLNECFADFTTSPAASASIAQVHFATLHDGQQVAVKVMHPNAKRIFYTDLFWINFFTKCIYFFGVITSTDLKKIVRELIYLTKKELDLSREALNMQRFHEAMAKDNIDHAAPYVLFPFSCKTVITMQRFEGVWLNEMIQAVLNKDSIKLEQWAQKGIYPHRTARIIFRSLAEQICHHRIIHGDPHVGNIVVINDGSVGFIDFGIVGELDEQNWRKELQLFHSMAERNVHQIYLALLAMVQPLPNQDMSLLEIETKRLLSDWILALKHPNANPEEKSNGRVLIKCANVFRRNKLQLPLPFLVVIRATLISDMLIYALYPKFDPTEELAQLFSEPGFPDLSSDLGQLLHELPSALLTLTSWVKYDFPLSSKLYGNNITIFEKILSNFLNTIRICGWLLIIGIVIVKAFRTSLEKVPAIEIPAIQWMASLGISSILGVILAIIVLSGLIRSQANNIIPS